MIKGTIAIKDKNGAIWPINISDIIAVEVDNYLCTFHLENGEKHYLVKSLKETLSLLCVDSESFMQIKRDAIINLTKIVKFKNNKVYLKLGHEYTIPVKKRKEIKDLLMKPNIRS